MSASNNEQGKRERSENPNQSQGDKKRLRDLSGESASSSSLATQSFKLNEQSYEKYQTLLKEDFPRHYEVFSNPKEYESLYKTTISKVFEELFPFNAILLNQLCNTESNVRDTALMSLATNLVALLLLPIQNWRAEIYDLFYFISKKSTQSL
jgi:hypothetical protein